MKTTLFSATLVATLFVLIAVANLPAQRNPAAPPANGVAVIDLQYVMKNCARVKAAAEKMEKDGEAMDAELKKEKASIEKMIEQSKDLKPSNIEYKKREEELTNRQAKLNVKVSLMKKEFNERKAKIYYDFLVDVNAAVRDFARHDGIGLVVQYSAEPLDKDNPNTINLKMSNPVVYQDGKDISDIILEDLNRRSGGVANKKTGTTQK